MRISGAGFHASGYGRGHLLLPAVLIGIGLLILIEGGAFGL